MMSLSDIAIPREKVVPEIADADLPGRRSQMLTRFGRELPSRLPGPLGIPDACDEDRVELLRIAVAYSLCE